MRSRSRWLRAFARSQRGTSYALPYVLVVPFYLAFVLAVFEMGFLLIAKIGTQTAAHAAARSAAVWHSAPAEKLPELRPKQAAWMALAAYAGGRQRELDAAGPVPPEAPRVGPLLRGRGAPLHRRRARRRLRPRSTSSNASS